MGWFSKKVSGNQFSDYLPDSEDSAQEYLNRNSAIAAIADALT
jgi:hypothetical protein